MARRFHPSRRGRTCVLFLLAVLLLVRGWQTWRDEPRPAVLSPGVHRVRRVVDGDTLLLASGARVRLLGIDAPESVKPEHPVEPWALEAKAFAQRFIAGGQVRLEFDRERVDRYDRYLAYVWVGEQLLNEELVRQGLARFEPQYRYSARMKRRFQRAQEEAQARRRGIWSGSVTAAPPVRLRRELSAFKFPCGSRPAAGTL